MNTRYTNHGAFIGPTKQPEEPAFQLPPPPPGMRWHREDGWKSDDLPQGYRPCVVDEREAISGYMESLPDRSSGLGWVSATYHSSGLDFYSFHHRTTRSLTFEHAGKTWTWHRPGDPTPCDWERMVHILTRDNDFSDEPCKAEDYEWNQIEGSGSFAEIIGWRYADEKKTVPLGPEDVRCGDEITIDEYDDVRRQVLAVESTHIHLSVYGRIDYETLRKRQAKIRRRDSNEFVPCSKTIPA